MAVGAGRGRVNIVNSIAGALGACLGVPGCLEDEAVMCCGSLV